MCMYKFVFNFLYFFLSARVAASSIMRICASGWFVRMKITTVHPILTIMFKNIVRTFEAEILKCLNI